MHRSPDSTVLSLRHTLLRHWCHLFSVSYGPCEAPHCTQQVVTYWGVLCCLRAFSAYCGFAQHAAPHCVCWVLTVVQWPAGQGSSSSPSRPGTSPDNLVASLRRLRPHVHAAGPFDATSRSDFVAKSVISKAALVTSPEQQRVKHVAQTKTAPTQAGHAMGRDLTAAQSSHEHAKHGKAVLLESGPAQSAQNDASISNDVASEPEQAAVASNAPLQDDRDSPAVVQTSSETDDRAYAQADLASYSPLQLHAISLTCSTVACLQIPHPSSSHSTRPRQPPNSCISSTPDQQQSASPECTSSATPDTTQQSASITCTVEARSQHLQELLSVTDSECAPAHQHASISSDWPVKVKWAVPIVAAQHVSASEGAVAVSCADGMLLLMDLTTGELVRYSAPAYCSAASYLASSDSLHMSVALPGICSDYRH